MAYKYDWNPARVHMGMLCNGTHGHFQIWAKGNEERTELLWSIWSNKGEKIASDMSMNELIAYLIAEDAEPIRNEQRKSDFMESRRER